MNLVTGYGGTTHITALQDSAWHRGIWSDDCIIEYGDNLELEFVGNQANIKSGAVIIQGRISIIEPNTYDSVTIENGTAGEIRKDLIVLRYEKNAETQIETTSLKVIQGIPGGSEPTYISGNIDNGDLIAEFPLYVVKVAVDGKEATRKMKIAPSISGAKKHGIITGASMTANTITSGDVTFDTPFNDIPFVSLTLFSASGNKSLGSTQYAISNVQNYGFTWKFFNNSSSNYSPYIYWCAEEMKW